MNFDINRDYLLKPLKAVIGVIQPQQILPVLSNVVLKVDSGMLTLVASDSEMELVSYAPTISVKKEGCITVPGRKLLDICQALSTDTVITFAREGDWIRLYGGEGVFNLVALSPDDFPRIPLKEQSNLASVSLKEATFLSLVQRTEFAMANEDVRYFLNGMLFEFNNKGVGTVATDGHRLAFNRISEAICEEELKVIVPRKAVQELLRLLKDTDNEVKIAIYAKHFSVEGNNFLFISRLIEGVYPDYSALIPKLGDNKAIVPAFDLKQGLLRTAVLANEKFRTIQLSFGQATLNLLAKNSVQEYAQDVVKIDYQGEDKELAFNINYLLDLLNALDTVSIHINFSQSNQGVLFKDMGDIDSTFVIMPVTL